MGTRKTCYGEIARSKVELAMQRKLQERLDKQYPLPPVSAFEPPYRFLHPHESCIDGDEVWNFHFSEWCSWREVVDCAVDEFEKYGCRKTNPIVISPRLNICRTKRPSTEFEKSHPVMNK